MRGEEYTKSASASRARAFVLAQGVTEPYMRHALAILSCSIPVMTMYRTDDGVVLTTTWPPEVQAALEELSRLAKDAVDAALYGAVYGGDVKLTGGYDLYARFDS